MKIKRMRGRFGWRCEILKCVGVSVAGKGEHVDHTCTIKVENQATHE